VAGIGSFPQKAEATDFFFRIKASLGIGATRLHSGITLFPNANNVRAQTSLLGNNSNGMVRLHLRQKCDRIGLEIKWLQTTRPTNETKI
jgi:hypothetical protein